MTLAAGTRIGSYEILGPLGAGGMGEVYRAIDSELHRTVALKVLPEHFITDPDRVARFEREATTLASINHPHVAQIYGIARDADGRAVLVMEFVEGEDLAARLRRGRLPLDEALAIARQVAAALEAAHEIGVIHRDLKPGNIQVRADGVVKVLDFGLARTADTRSPSGAVDAPTISPTITEPGIIFGTAAYMSPEQAKGLSLDRRSDLWSFGCVLFEMLSGRRAFNATTGIETIAAVLSHSPEWDRLPADAPQPIRRLLRQCLVRERAQRIDSAAVARLAIEEVLSSPSTDPAPTTPARRGPNMWVFGGLALVTVAIVATIAWLPRAPTAVSELRLDIATPPTADAYSFALSPDGRRIAFVSGGSGNPLQLWTRTFDSATATPVPNTEGAVYPFWSPDGRSIGFFAGGKLKRVELSSGLAVTLADAAAGAGGSWGANGQILFTQSASAPIYLVSADGSAVRTVTSLAPGDGGHVSPTWHPDGRRFLFLMRNGDPDKRGSYLATLDRPERARLMDAEGTAEFRGTNEILYVRDGTLYVQAFDDANNVMTGAARPVASPVPTSDRRSAFSASRAGPMAYRKGRMDGAQLWWFARNGARLEAFGSPDPEGLSGPVLSPTGQRVAVVRRPGGNADIWLSDRRGGAATRVTSNPAQEVFPVWMPDERAIVFRSSRGPTLDIYQARLDIEGHDTVVLSGGALGIGQISPTDISRDGRWLLFYSTPQGASRDIWAYPVGQPDATPRKLVGTSADETSGRFSPDGRWIAYQTDESGRFEIAVREFLSGDRVWQVSTAGGVHPRWSRDGRELFYVAPDGNLMAVQVSAAGSLFRTNTAVPLFAPRFAASAAANPFNAQYDVGADGRFLINLAVDDLAASPITLILNWTATGR